MVDPKFPMCCCGAGVCRRGKVTCPNEGRYFFAFPNGEVAISTCGHDTLLGIPDASAFTPCRVVSMVVDWDSSPLHHFKKMRIIRDHHGSEHFIIPIATSPEAKISTLANCNPVDFPDRITVIPYESLRSVFQQALQEEACRLEERETGAGEIKARMMKPPQSRL